ncbi:helix-turn-helix domain-containing protein [Hyphococcus sp.]|uniref:helix-turn-helix domain-containing protein n=1 Tax=Hyphococcus sp. TaxID=2038636 RepID=UPI0026A1BE76
MEKYSTIDLPTNGRTAAWNALYASRMSQVEFTPADKQGFGAELSIGTLGPVKLAKLSMDCYSVERSKLHINDNRPRIYSLLLQAKGSSVIHHCGHEANLDQGDFVLVDTGLPHFFDTKDFSTTIMVRVLPSLLREYLPTPEQFTGHRLGHAVGLAGTLGAMVESLSESVGAGIQRDHEERVARYLLEMISMSYTAGFDISEESAVLWRRRNDVISFIEDNLRDPELCCATIAKSLNLSPRYLRSIFSVSGEKISAFILRRRLEECARQMRNPAWNGHTLTEIAFSWGFNSAAHFTRCFRDQFGMAPREYRSAAVTASSTIRN